MHLIPSDSWVACGPALWHSAVTSLPCKEKVTSTTVEELEAEALTLSNSQRARLVEKLIASLDSEPEIENA